MRNGNGGGGGFVFGFLAGAVVGGAVAVLLSQEETRDLLAGKAREAGNRAMDATEDLRGKVNDATMQWRANASDIYSRGKQVVDDARSTVESAVQEGKAAAGKTREEMQWHKDV